MGPSMRVRSPIWSLLISALLVSSLGTAAANASQRLSVLFGPICIWVFELEADKNVKTRAEMAGAVSSAVRAKVEAAEPGGKRKVWAAPDCIRPDQAGFDRQLTLQLSIKREIVKLDGRDWNVVVAGGVSRDGLFQDREIQPVIIVQRESVSDDRVVEALVEFVDRTVVATVRSR